MGVYRLERKLMFIMQSTIQLIKSMRSRYTKRQSLYSRIEIDTLKDNLGSEEVIAQVILEKW